LRLLEHERNIRETELLDADLEKLEAVLERQDGRRQWTG
jgi:hypothetical protein